MGRRGVEPPPLAGHAPQACAYTRFRHRPKLYYSTNLVPQEGLEPSYPYGHWLLRPACLPAEALVPERGVEPPTLSGYGSEPYAYTIPPLRQVQAGLPIPASGHLYVLILSEAAKLDKEAILLFKELFFPSFNRFYHNKIYSVCQKTYSYRKYQQFLRIN